MDSSRARISRLALAGLLGLLAGRSGDEGARPNVLLVVVDTLRVDHTGIAGYARNTTPRLDAWARESGVSFTQARAPSPWTKPSVASLMTGLDPRRHGATLHTSRLPSSLASLPESFSEHGWRTWAVQSNLLLSDYFGFGRGFDVYEEVISTHDRSTGEEAVEAARAFLGRAGTRAGTGTKGRPFFLYVHLYEPHFRYLSREEFEFGPPYDGPLTGDESMDELAAATDRLGPEDVGFLEARYDGEIAYADDPIGRILDALAELDLGDTLVVVTADHGEEFLDHGDLSHRAKLFDELLRVPLWIARPGQTAPGRRVDAPVSLADLPRTLLDLAGLGGVEFPGRSFAPWLDGESTGERRAVMAHVATLEGREEGEPPRDIDAIVVDGWKLIRERGSLAGSLYDLGSDPRERRNLAKEFPAELSVLEEKLDAWIEARPARPREDPPAELTPALMARLRELGYFSE